MQISDSVAAGKHEDCVPARVEQRDGLLPGAIFPVEIRISFGQYAAVVFRERRARRAMFVDQMSVDQWRVRRYAGNGQS